MAGGWTHDGGVLDQIEDTVTDGVLHARARLPSGESALFCDDAARTSHRRAAPPCPGFAPASPASRDATSAW